MSLQPQMNPEWSNRYQAYFSGSRLPKSEELRIDLAEEREADSNIPVLLSDDEAVAIREARQLLTIETQVLAHLAQAADAYVRVNLFTERQEAKAWNTVRKEIASLSNFMAFLQATAGLALSFHLAEEPRLWQAITFGLVKLFLRWERERGYSIKTLNDHLSVIKLYAKLAHQAGFQSADQLLAITNLTQIRGAEAARIDGRRKRQQIPTRIGPKKAEPTFLEREAFQALLNRPNTPQGWRDRVAILLMYDLSLRPSEVVSLCIHDLNMDEGTLVITRHKTHDVQRARLTQRLQVALTRYLSHRKDTSSHAPLLVRSRKNEELVEHVSRSTPAIEEAKRGGRRPFSPNHALYVQKQQDDLAYHTTQHDEDDPSTLWTPPITTRALAKHLHTIGLEIGQQLYGDNANSDERINLTSYDGRHEWTRSAIRAGSDPIAVTKAGGWKGHSPMVARYYGELQIVNEDIRLKR